MARHGAAFLLSLTLAGAVPAWIAPAWIAPAWITPAWAETADQMAAPAEAMASALAAAGTGDWIEAESIAARMGDPVAEDLILWLRLRDGLGGWGEMQAFLAREPGWPNRDTIRRFAERAMPAALPAPVTLAFFREQPPLTGTGALRLSEALAATGQGEAADKEILHAWRAMSLTETERQAILADHAALVAPEDEARLDMLLWRGLTGEATAMLSRVSPERQALARARIAVRLDQDGSSAAIAAVPAALADDPGLAYERYRYRVEKGRWEDAEAFLVARSTSAEALGRPDAWMERRANLARQALRDGDVATAYALAANNFGNDRSGPDYADAEWVAGYVALTAMEDPQRAAGHFERFQAAVGSPISLGRAGYWLGLAYERAGEPEKARAAYLQGARYQTSFYGQLAAQRIGVEADPAIAGGETTPDWRTAAFLTDSAVRAAQLLAAAGDDARATLFLRQAARSLPADQRAALAQMEIDQGRPHVGLRIAKDAATDGLILPSQYYPLHPMAGEDWPVPTEFALAIARQESEFNAAAASKAGARGLMQLMPATAEATAGRIGAPYDLARLTADPMYNATLGTTYLGQMLETYGGSYILAAAAYNAGPGRVGQWLQTYGDPRTGEVDAVRWIESIPYEETRNYVMRVLESLHVYRARLQGATPPLQLASDIKRAT